MQEQPSAGSTYSPGTDEVAGTLLNVLLDRHPALVSVEELVRYAAFPSGTAFSEMCVDEGLDDLARWGLAHRLDRFAFASHAAVRVGELQQ
jgi:hypothetical protein